MMINVLALTAILGMFHMNTHARDYLDPNKPTLIKFTIATQTNNDSATVTVSFLSDGLQMVAAGGSVSVNGKILPSFPLRKQGFWYWTLMPKSALYKLEYSLGAGHSVVVREVAAREFSAVMPSAISRKKGAVIPFNGPPPSSTESIFVTISTSEAGQREITKVLEASVSGGTVIIPASELSSVQLGDARLNLSMVRNERSAVYNLTYRHKSRHSVTVKE